MNIVWIGSYFWNGENEGEKKPIRPHHIKKENCTFRHNLDTLLTGSCMLRNWLIML